MESSSSDVALCLKHAYGFIEDGWCQGASRVRYADGSTRFCLVGAVIESSVSAGAFSAAALRMECYQAIVAAIGEPLIEHHYDIPTWNDRAGRTKKEVLQVVEKAIERVQCSS